MKNANAKVLVVVGATASGKTSLAVSLATQFVGEVISADSRQVYRQLDVGTAKITPEEQQGIPHHCLDVANVNDVYTAQQFVADASAAITDITSRGKLPIIAGGTFFYVDLLLGRATMPAVPPNPELRAKFEALSTDELFAELRELDANRAASIDPHNKRRLVRALEIISSLGHVPKIPSEEPYDTLWLGIDRSKEDLRARYQTRAEAWLNSGFREEMQWLLAQNLPASRIDELGFEYVLGRALVTGEITETEFVEQFIAKNWQYAKRQLTWLRKNEAIHWLQPDDTAAATPTVTKWLED